MAATQGLLLVNGVGTAIGSIIVGVFMKILWAQGLMVYLGF